MKRILVAISTFSIGISVVGLLRSEPDSGPPQLPPVVEISETTLVKVLNDTKPNNLPTFFNSFEKDEGYYCWLIPYEFSGMKEVWTVLLSRDRKGNDSEKLVWSAMILTTNPDGSPNDDDIFTSIWIKTENDRLSFKTNKTHGVSYEFDGKFFKVGKKFADDEPVLKGTMRKIVKGKEVAKFTADFSYSEPHCFH